MMHTTVHDGGSTLSERSARHPVAMRRTSTGAFETIGVPMEFARNEEIYCEGDPVEYLYKVASGTVRTCKVLADGRRQIGAFHLAGDIFGFDVGAEHGSFAEAVTNCTILVVKRSALTELAARDGAVARELWVMANREVARVQDHMPLLVKSAQERVAGFLLELAARQPGGDTVELPMSRQDIADYLGLTIETVSRTLTALEQEAAIALPNSRRIVLRNRPALREMNA